MSEGNRKFIVSLPRLIPDDDTVNNFMESAQTFDGGMKSTVLVNMLINIALSGSLQMVWGMINTLQITLHLPAINTKSPTNV